MEVDLDVITEKPLKIKLGGKVYEVRPLKMRPYLATQSLQNKLEAAYKKNDSAKQVEASIDLIMAFAPAIPRDALMDATLGQLLTLMNTLALFQRGPGDEGNVAGAESQ